MQAAFTSRTRAGPAVARYVACEAAATFDAGLAGAGVPDKVVVPMARTPKAMTTRNADADTLMASSLLRLTVTAAKQAKRTTFHELGRTWHGADVPNRPS